jgi:Fe-S-cluster-containing hydrogenase component 2
MCATFCPTGAIYKFDEADGTLGIEHYPADCVQCRLCEDVCSAKCLEVSSEVEVRGLLEGSIERYEMHEPQFHLNEPDQIYQGIKALIPNANIYEMGGGRVKEQK